MRTKSIRGGIVFTLTAMVLVCTGSSWAALNAHNGSVASGGSGAVNVDLFSVSAAGGLQLGLAFHQSATHVLEGTYDAPAEPPVFVAEFAINNETAQSWGAFVVQLFGSDFFGVNGVAAGGPLAQDIDPVVPGGNGPTEIAFLVNAGSIALAGSAIGRDGENALLYIAFADPVDPGESFGLAFFISDVGTPDANYVIAHTPLVIPEPGSLALLAIGAATAVARRRKR